LIVVAGFIPATALGADMTAMNSEQPGARYQLECLLDHVRRQSLTERPFAFEASNIDGVTSVSITIGKPPESPAQDDSGDSAPVDSSTVPVVTEGGDTSEGGNAKSDDNDGGEFIKRPDDPDQHPTVPITPPVRTKHRRKGDN